MANLGKQGWVVYRHTKGERPVRYPIWFPADQKAAAVKYAEARPAGMQPALRKKSAIIVREGFEWE